MRALAKLAGKVEGFEDEIDLESAIAQSHVHKDVNKLVLVVSILENLQNTHPFVPARLRQLKEWAESLEYERVLGGSYDRDFLGLHEGGIRVACGGCGEKVNAKLKFCPKCGRQVVLKELEAGGATVGACGACGHPLGAGIKFCTVCGAKQDGAASEPRLSGLDKIASRFKRS
jgi:ribosomal protein S27AE